MHLLEWEGLPVCYMPIPLSSNINISSHDHCDLHRLELKCSMKTFLAQGILALYRVKYCIATNIPQSS